ncbi:MAG: hypothetical protein A2Y75_02605 [Candidatus Solincola sediminis]|uniref:SSD domain-containing protein n=1 Tax=Candidatus Solincola sediminis TaxID=1797199 RepID=A0A1F2WJM9_9ACTN|nr:MAG: hypothetical protein A2Y75_02605 [Candidatus Solincola sediminis]
MGFFARLCRDHAKAVVIICILLTLPVAAGMFRIKVKAGQKDLIPTKYETSRTLDQVDELFGGITYEIPMIQSNHLLEYPMIKKFLLLEKEAEKNIGDQYYVSIQHYLSAFALNAIAEAKQRAGIEITDISTIFALEASTQPSLLHPDQMVPFPQVIEEGVQLYLADPTARKWMTEKQGLQGLLSIDMKYAQVLIKINPDLSSAEEKEAAVKIEDFFHSYFEESDPPASVVVGGDPSINRDLEEYVYKSSWFLGLLAFGLLLLLLYLFFQRITDVIFPLFTIVIAAIWIYGLMGWIGYPYTEISIALGPLVLGISLGDLLYMITRFYEELGIRGQARKASTKAIVTVGVATFIVAVCTVVAFFSFRLSDFDVLQQFGIMAAVGVGVAFVFTVTLLPSLMILREDYHKSRGKEGPARGTKLFDRERRFRIESLLERIAGASKSHASAVLVIFGFIVLICLLGSFRLTTEPDLRALAPKGLPALEAQYAEEAVFGGQQQDVLLLTGDVLQPQALLAMHDFQERLAATPYFDEGSTSSIGELVHDFRMSGSGGSVGQEGEDFAAYIPSSKAEVEETIARIGSLMGPQEGFLISEDHQAALVNIMSEGAKTNEEVRDRYKILNENAAACFDPIGINWKLAGITPLTENMLGNLVPTQVWTAILALGLSALVLMLIFRSIVYGLIALSVLAVSIAAEMGFLVLMDWKLDMMTVLIASIVIGVGIDFGIQFIYRFREELKRSGTVEEALDTTIRTVGKPIIAGAISMAIAFAIIVFSRMAPIQRFGAITAVCLLVSLAASMLVVPSLLVLMARRQARAASKE